MKVAIIGSGNVAYHMARMMKRAEVPVIQIYARNIIAGKRLAKYAKAEYIQDIEKLNDNADIYVICISDDAIETFATSLPQSIKHNKIVVHTSGSMPLDALISCAHRGVFYPLQTFTYGKRTKYSSIPFCINGVNEQIKVKLESLAQKISAHTYIISDEQRKTIHISAVMINNFITHLIYKSETLLSEANIDPRVLQALLTETIRKQASLGAKNAQTGPAKRGDQVVIDDHIHQLKGIDKDIYSIISKSITETYK